MLLGNQGMNYCNKMQHMQLYIVRACCAWGRTIYLKHCAIIF